MRYCRARRLAQQQCLRGEIDYDPFLLVEALPSYSLLWHNGIYSLTFWLGNYLESRENSCCYRLFLVVGRMLTARMATIQGSTADQGGVKALGTHMAQRVGRAYSMPWTRPRYPSILSPGFAFDTFQGGIERWCAAEGIDVSGYINSRDIIDPDLRTEALTMLAESVDPPPRDDEADDIVKALLLLWCSTPDLCEDIDPLTPERLMEMPVGKSASGAVAVHGPGAVGGSKELMISSAVLGWADLGLQPYEAYPKPEVIKRGKKVRQITVEPMLLYLKSSYFSQHYVRRHGMIVDGSAVGLSRHRFVSIFQSIYQDERVFQPSLDWDEFLDLVDEVGLCEDDKVSWEKTTNRFGAFVAGLYACSQVRIHPRDVGHFAQVLAHDMCPFIKYNGHDCYAAPYKTASGKFKTLHDNTIKHLAGLCAVQAHLQEHHFTPGADCCGGVVLTMHEVSRIVGGCKLGDDSIRLSCHDQLVANLTDLYLGSTTQYERVKAFSDPGDSSGEFLRVQVRRRGRVLTTRRDPERVFAKLVHGDARRNKDTFKAALTSASLELGDDEEANAKLLRLYNSLDWSEVGDIAYGGDLLSRGEGLEEGDPCEPFSHAEVVIKQNSHLDYVDEINARC